MYFPTEKTVFVATSDRRNSFDTNFIRINVLVAIFNGKKYLVQFPTDKPVFRRKVHRVQETVRDICRILSYDFPIIINYNLPFHDPINNEVSRDVGCTLRIDPPAQLIVHIYFVFRFTRRSLLPVSGSGPTRGFQRRTFLNAVE